MKLEEWQKTELDGRYYWKCAECNFGSFFMYEADTHQCETDHMFNSRISNEEYLKLVKEKNK